MVRYREYSYDQTLMLHRSTGEVCFFAQCFQVIVRKWLDGSVHVFTKDNKELLVEELNVRPKKNEEVALSA